jgi:hypothetical protein
MEVYADPNGAEHFSPGDTKNAQTTFDGSGDEPQKITAAIDGYLKQSPDKPSPPAGSWTEHQGLNCYGDRDGHGSHGARDLEHPAWASCGNYDTVDECEQKCRELDGCTAITVTRNPNGQYACFRKADVVPSQCDSGTGFDTYTLND